MCELTDGFCVTLLFVQCSVVLPTYYQWHLWARLSCSLTEKFIGSRHVYWTEQVQRCPNSKKTQRNKKRKNHINIFLWYTVLPSENWSSTLRQWLITLNWQFITIEPQGSVRVLCKQILTPIFPYCVRSRWPTNSVTNNGRLACILLVLFG